MIIIVDDNPFSMRAYKSALSLKGFSVIVVSTVAEFLELFEKTKDIEALILDVMLPPGPFDLHDAKDGLDTGLLLLKKIREANSELPVVLLTVRRDLNYSLEGDSKTILLLKGEISPFDLVEEIEIIIKK